MAALTGLRNRVAGWLAPELRAVEATSLLGLTGTTLAGDAISARTAETVATFSACVQLIASSMAYLPSRVYRAGRTRTEVMENPLYRLMREGPNPLQTWPDFIEAMVAQVLLHGNALAAIETDDSGNLTALRFIPWGWVAPVLLPSGRLAYDVTEGSAMLGAVGRRYRLLSGEVLHLKDRSDDGLLGVSRLRRAASTVLSAKTTNEFAATFMSNGAAPSGALTYEGRMDPEQKNSLKYQFEARQSGVGNAGRIMVLDQGLKFQPYQISPEDTELLASRKFAVEEICRLFQVPPPLIQDYSHNTFTNSETAGRWFAQFTLAPWARKIEAEFGRALFTAGSGLELEIDLSGFLRGDPQTRWAAHKIAVDAGILDADEVREIEGFNPRDKSAGAAPTSGEA